MVSWVTYDDSPSNQEEPHNKGLLYHTHALTQQVLRGTIVNRTYVTHKNLYNHFY